MAIIPHPWQNGPKELIEHALYHLHLHTDFDQRIAYLLLDVGVETIFKTFLTLPQDVTQSQGSYSKREEAATGNFHNLVNGVRDAAEARVTATNLSHIEFYHDLRNKLYHQGNGITIPTDKVQEYAKLAVELLRILLDVDLSNDLAKPAIEANRLAEIQKLRDRINEQKNSISKALENLNLIIQETIEKIEPKLVLPSFSRLYYSVRSKYTETYYTHEGNKFERLSEDSQKRQQFINEIVQLLHSLISDSTIKDKLFKMETLPFGNGKIETVVSHLAFESEPDSFSILVRVIEIMESKHPVS
jgi:hypothetical protein